MSRKISGFRDRSVFGQCSSPASSVAPPSAVPPCRRAGWCVILSLATASLPGFAADGPPPGSLGRSSELTFNVLLEQALPRTPEFLEIAARDEEARLRMEAARSWVAGRPSWQVSYLDDRPRSDEGATELEYGIEAPLWRPGERRDARRLGAYTEAQSEAWKAHLTLTVAGRLRHLLSDLDLAERLVVIEQETLGEARQVVESVEQLFAAGELARLDVMQARGLLLQQQRQELEARTALARAETAYSLATGLNARPQSVYRETVPSEIAIEPTHPWLRFLTSGVDVAEAAVRQARMEAKGSPALTLGSRRQRGSRTEPHHDSLLVALSLPFGGGAHVSAQTVDARRARTDADIQLLSAQRELELQLEDARRDLEATHAALELGEAQAALDRNQGEMARAAFDEGEITLFQLLTTLRQTRISIREREILSLKKERAVIQLNQVIGVLP